MGWELKVLIRVRHGNEKCSVSIIILLTMMSDNDNNDRRGWRLLYMITYEKQVARSRLINNEGI